MPQLDRDAVSNFLAHNPYIIAKEDVRVRIEPGKGYRLYRMVLDFYVNFGNQWTFRVRMNQHVVFEGDTLDEAFDHFNAWQLKSRLNHYPAHYPKFGAVYKTIDDRWRKLIKIPESPLDTLPKNT